MSRAGISIVIPTLGDLRNLKNLISSIFAQESVDRDWLDVVIVVNGVTSDSFFKIKNAITLEVPNFNFQWAHFEQANVNKARNKGLDLANFEHICFFDDDCELINGSTLSFYGNCMIKDPQLFALGGGYLLPHKANYWDELYNSIQMAWLLSGRLDQNSNNLHLLGGNFILNSKILKSHFIKFDERISYGGSEHQLFVQAANLKLKVQVCNVDVRHNTNESFFKICNKIFKQGRGKATIEEKLSPAEISTKNQNYNFLKTRSFAMNYSSLKAEFFKKILNYVFWAGYYNKKKKTAYVVVKVIADFINYLNYLRYRIIDKFK